MRFLVALLALVSIAASLGIAASAQDVERVVRIHDCRFIVTRGQDFPGPDLTRLIGYADFEETAEDAEFMPTIDPDLLIEMIRRNVRPDTWHHERNKIRLAEGRLTVVQTPAVQEEVTRFLDVLRRARMRRVVITAHALTVRKDHFGSYLLRAMARPGGTLLAPEDLAKFFGSEVVAGAVSEVASVTLDALPGQRVHAGPFRRLRYVRDIDVEVAEQAAASAPVVDTLDTGTIFEMRPFVAGASSVLLDLRLASAAQVGDVTPVDTGVGNIQMVQRSIQSLESTVLVPKDHGVLLAASRPGPGGRVMVFILRPRIVGKPAAAAKAKAQGSESAGGTREMRIFNTRLLTTRIPDRPCPDTNDDDDQGEVGWITFEGDGDEGVGMEADDLIEMIKSSIAEDTWSNTRNSVKVVGDLLVVVQRPEVLAEIGKLLDQLRSRRGLLVNSVVRVLAVDAERLGDYIPAEARHGRALTALEVENLERAAHQGGGVRRVESAALLGFNRQLAHVRSLRERTVIRRMEVEVASKSSISDPVVGALRTGLTLAVRPSSVGDGKHFRLDLDCRLVTSTEPELFPIKKGEAAGVHHFETRAVGVRTSAYLEDGATLAYLRGTAPGLENHRLVFLVSVRAVRVKG
jgi:hypothetical protein